MQAEAASDASCITDNTCLGKWGDVVILGQPLQFINVASVAALALDPKWALPYTSPHQCLVTAEDTARPQIRTTWVPHETNGEDNIAYEEQLKEGDILHSGQHIRIANKGSHTGLFFYLHSSVRDLCHVGSQPLIVSQGECKDNIFVVNKPGERRVDIRGGGPVHIGEPFVLYHAATSQPARCTMKQQKTSLGFELEVNRSFAGDNFSRSIAAVTNHQ
ncbi:hypothetical protein ERJ75_000496900 [Trypanosoma vivax]|uniref:Uncharacterized protein n=1 Tax=Trypanosoma vivax (strain Y486) TaxID=1055687 RepID=F9WT58_TRYVY|nr:hypothetical protein ERJ75_000561100 [Trypanosoma vivax]KAH8616248.1 hypothetical protein ERJ75_000496900 [Trypanosoma vivax]CCD20749.1 hypothetical protein TvY486_0036200 [Trypanosoma vivax Y486]|eukprot:CCD20749.1 hypothetical protein TvY486_0036200 [Trypanosoma vivax Y486]